MIYRILVNAAFLAVGYCIGRAVSQSLAADRQVTEPDADGDEASPMTTEANDFPAVRED